MTEVAKEVVWPLTADFNAAATANMNQVQTETVSRIDANWDLSISTAAAAAVFGAFTLTEGVSDTSADIVVTYADTASVFTNAVKAALENAVSVAEGGTDAHAGGMTLHALMLAAIRVQNETNLASGGLFDIMEAEVLGPVTLSNDAIGTDGAAAAAARFAGASQPILNLIGTQLPYDRYGPAPGQGPKNMSTVFKAGDSLTLRFQVTSSLAITPVFEDVTGANDAQTTPSATSTVQSPFTLSSNVRTFNLRIIKP